MRLSLTHLAVYRKIAMLMLMIAIAFMGAIAYTQLPVRRLPNVSFPHLAVVLHDPGVSPSMMRLQIVDPVENALTKVNGIVTMTSLARNGMGRVDLRFPGGTNMNAVAAEVSRTVNAMAGQLPAGTQPPVILQADPNALPVMNIAVYGSLGQASMYNLVTNTVAPAIMAVPGVAVVNVVGARPPQVNVTASAPLLEENGLTLSALAGSIKGDNHSTPAGQTDHGGQTFPVVVSGSASSLTSLAATPVGGGKGGKGGGKQLTVGQVASVSEGYAPVTTTAQLNGQTAIGLVVSVQSNANSLTTVANIKRAMANLQDTLPSGVQMKVTGDITQYTRDSMTATQADLFLAILAAAVMIAVWLHRLRLTAVVLLTIPTVLLGTFLGMYFMGFSLDMMSLMALSLLIGILVDDTIVVLENIVRHHRMGSPPREAAVSGRLEIAGAAVAITLTDVVVYAPVAFMQGNIGQLFREFGLTIVFASLFSLFVSFTLTPLLAAHFALRGRPSKVGERFSGWFERRFESLVNRYERGLRKTFRRPVAVLLAAAAAMVFDVMSLRDGWIPTTYTPPQNSSVFYVNVRMPEGTSVPVTDLAVRQLASGIRGIPGVTSVLSITGFGSGSVTSSNIGRLTVDLSRSRPVPNVFSIETQTEALAQKIPGMRIQTGVPNALLNGGGGGGSLSVVLRGPSLSTLDALSAQTEAAFSAIPGVKNVTSTAQATAPQLSIQMNPGAAQLFGLSTHAVGQAIRLAVQGATVSQYRPTPESVSQPIVLQLDWNSPNPQTGVGLSPSPGSGGGTGSGALSGIGSFTAAGQGIPVSALMSLPVGTFHGQTVTLGQVASVKLTQSPGTEREYDRELQVQVSANTGNQPLGAVAAQARKALSKLRVPAGYSFKFNGAIRQQGRAFGPLTQALELAVLLIYMLLAALYESFIDPAAVLFSLPLALTGALAGLLITGVPFSMYAFIAVIMLTGLVAKNAILLIDFAKRGAASGMDMADALAAAGRVRIRPILMTTGTMIIAMFPLALHLGAGASQRMPMAIVLIGGMASSTLLSLFLVPVFYLLLWRAKIRVNRLIQTLRRADSAPESTNLM